MFFVGEVRGKAIYVIKTKFTLKINYINIGMEVSYGGTFVTVPRS